MLVRTVIWRSFSRRAMMLAPLTTRISASCDKRDAAAIGGVHQDVAEIGDIGSRFEACTAR